MIVSCGDSFFYGSDLSSTNATWPALIAQSLKSEYKCYAQPGAGNLRILQQLIQAIARHGKNAIYLVNWSWIERFDYVSTTDEQWHTIRPSLDDMPYDNVYYKYFHSELADKFKNLVCISQACDLLQGHKYLMTYMDPLMLDQQYHAPDYVQFLQSKIQSQLHTFNGQTFLEWSRNKGYPESEKWHPLEEAHQQAAEFWYGKVAKLAMTVL